MTRLIVTTNRREAHLEESSGWLFVIDLEAQTVLRQTSGLEPPYRAFDHNPRGGMRGMRGLGICNGELVTADYSSVYFFDKHWNLLRTISHPSVSGIHEILCEAGGIWVTSTVNDMLVRFDLQGNLAEHHYLRENKDLMRRVNGPRKLLFQAEDIRNGNLDFRKRSYFKSDTYDRLHVNGLTRAPDGRMILSLGLIVGDMFGFLMNLKTIMRRAHIWNLFLAVNRFTRRILGLRKHMLSDIVVQPSQGTSAVISWDGSNMWDVHVQFPVTHNPSHSVRFLADGSGVYLNSSRGEIVHFGLDGRLLSSNKVTDEFLRGLLVLPDGRLAVGAGNQLMIYDIQAHRIFSQITLTEDIKNSVFDIQVFPPEYDLPPLSLQEKTGRMIGFEGTKIIWEGQAGAHPDPHS